MSTASDAVGDTLETPTAAAAHALGVDPACLAAVTQRVDLTDAQAIGFALAELVADAPDRVLGDADGRATARWGVVETADGDRLVLESALVVVPAGVVAPSEAVVCLRPGDWEHTVEVLAPRDTARAVLGSARDFVSRTTEQRSPFRFGQYSVKAVDTGLGLTRLRVLETSRDDLLVPDHVWAAVDRHVHGPLALAGRLADAGLSASSGVLCVGPPGTGKSALARIVAAELRGRATVLVPHARTAEHHLRMLMRLAGQLAPTLVVIDDLDLVVGARHAGAESLHEFLSAMDRLLDVREGVFVMASTNAPESIDPAAIRASRFDAVVEMAKPTAEARAAVLTRLLRTFPAVDVSQVARATSGTSGADLRDLVRRAFVDTGGEITTAALLTAAEHGRWRDAPITGGYI